MKRILRFFNKHQFVFSILIVFLSVITGGGIMAEAIANPDDGLAGASSETNDMEAPGVTADGVQNTAGQNLTGTVASATQLRGGGLVELELDEIVAKFRPWAFPLHTDMITRAKTKQLVGYEATHVQSGSAILDLEFKTVKETSATTLSLTAADLSTGKVSMLPARATFQLMSALTPGYQKGSATKKQGFLQLFVESNDGTTAICRATNGAYIEGSDYTTIPAIAIGTKIMVLANALSESEILVAPENYQPRLKTAYLQKRAMNITFTDKFKEQVKKVPFLVDDIKGEGLYNYRRKAARSLLLSSPSKFTVTDPKMGEELVYTEEGVLQQLTMMYGVGDEIELVDLNALCKLMFTEYAAGDTARAYCGMNFIEKLLNMKKLGNIQTDLFKTDKDAMGIKVRYYQNNFGTIEFVHEPALNDIGYADFAIIVDIDHARRYVERDSKEYNYDMKNNPVEPREAQKYVRTDADCLCLKGYNSILVGPSNSIGTMNLSDSATSVLKTATLPENPSDKQIIYLTAAVATLEAGYPYQYSATTKTWTKYTGAINVA